MVSVAIDVVAGATVDTKLKYSQIALMSMKTACEILISYFIFVKIISTIQTNTVPNKNKRNCHTHMFDRQHALTQNYNHN